MGGREWDVGVEVRSKKEMATQVHNSNGLKQSNVFMLTKPQHLTKVSISIQITCKY